MKYFAIQSLNKVVKLVTRAISPKIINEKLEFQKAFPSSSHNPKPSFLVALITPLLLKSLMSFSSVKISVSPKKITGEHTRNTGMPPNLR